MEEKKCNQCNVDLLKFCSSRQAYFDKSPTLKLSDGLFFYIYLHSCTVFIQSSTKYLGSSPGTVCAYVLLSVQSSRVF